MQINKKLHLCECKLFEVGGKNKKRKQIADIPNSFLVKDDIEYMVERTIPLWMFGLMYHPCQFCANHHFEFLLVAAWNDDFFQLVALAECFGTKFE